MVIEQWVNLGREIVETKLRENEQRSQEILAGIDGERFHTHDTHRLVLLLTDGTASPELQIAAMAHDIERFTVWGAGGGFKGERKGPQYQAYKKQHALKGSQIMSEELKRMNVPQTIVDRVVFLIAHHDDSLGEVESFHDLELEVLVAADSLSWLNFSAPNYFNGIEKKGIPGLIDKMLFMLRKLPVKFWCYIPKIELIEPKVLPYLMKYTEEVAQERNITAPKFV